MLRTPLRRPAARLGLALAVAALLAGCGGSAADDVPEGAVAVVNGDPITQREFDRWYDVTMREAAFVGSPLSDHEIRERTLSTLIRARWARGEAQELQIEIPESELRKEWKRTIGLEYVGGNDFAGYKRETGLTDEEIKYRIATGKYTMFLQRAAQARAGGADAPDVDEKMLAYNNDYTDRWTALTICAKDYLISDCSNYQDDA